MWPRPTLNWTTFFPLTRTLPIPARPLPAVSRLAGRRSRSAWPTRPWILE
jgi:hypothetical protein